MSHAKLYLRLPLISSLDSLIGIHEVLSWFMSPPTGIPLVLGVLVLRSLPIQDAGLSTGSRIRGSTNQDVSNLSVFPGKAGFDAFNGSPVTSGVFGDGTMIDYRFFHNPSDVISSYPDSGAGLIGGASSPAANIWDAGLKWSHL